MPGWKIRSGPGRPGTRRLQQPRAPVTDRLHALWSCLLMNPDLPPALTRFLVRDRVAVITGGAQGIGLAAARALHDAGAEVWLLDRDIDTARRAAATMARAQALAVDVGDADSIDRAFDTVGSRCRRIDILVANAGASIRRPALELTLAEWNQVLAVNLTGSFLCARAAAARMPAEGGAIVATTSVMGLSGGGPYPNPAYHATKGALVNLTRSLAVEWAPRGIRVNAVAPTWTRTAFIGALGPQTIERIEALMPMRRLAEPEEVASAILYLASPAASMVTGHVLAVDGGFLAQ
jgi:NAD(P)-dependent dehydrogenase (short-subunit alcohol dehydrogenase family)